MKRPKLACVDCWARYEAKGEFPRESQLRPAPHAGPRCATDHRLVRKARAKARAHTRTLKIYGITGEEKGKIVEEQGGGCICAKWTGYRGQTRALSVDHDHATGLVRGVLCKHCNDLLGRIRDDPTYFEKMLDYLIEPPARRVVGERKVREE